MRERPFPIPLPPQFWRSVAVPPSPPTWKRVLAVVLLVVVLIGGLVVVPIFVPAVRVVVALVCVAVGAFIGGAVFVLGADDENDQARRAADFWFEEALGAGSEAARHVASFDWEGKRAGLGDGA